jgi:hypothetical protein
VETERLAAGLHLDLGALSIAKGDDDGSTEGSANGSIEGGVNDSRSAAAVMTLNTPFFNCAHPVHC